MSKSMSMSNKVSVEVEANDQILRARIALILNNPFFGTLLMHMGVHIADDPSIDTMATDGTKLYINPQFVLEQTEEDLVFICAHEVMHVALEHVFRRGYRELKQWNYACDFVVNQELVSAGFKAPKTALLDLRYKDMSAEEVYEILEKQKQNQQQKQAGAGAGGAGDKSKGDQGNDPGRCGGIIDPEGDEVDRAQQLAETRTHVKQAAAIAKGQHAGKLPSSIERIIKMAEPAIDWRPILRNFVDDACSQDYTWTRQSRNSLDTDYYLPGVINNGMSHLVVAVDTSGSIDTQVLNIFMAEVQAAVTAASIAKVSVLYADAKVQSVDVFDLGDEIVARPKGGGGTCFKDTFRHISKEMPDAPLVIYFTDLEVYTFGEQPDGMQVLFAVNNSESRFKQLENNVPFGQAIRISR